MMDFINSTSFINSYLIIVSCLSVIFFILWYRTSNLKECWKKKFEDYEAAYHFSIENKNAQISEMENVRSIEFETLEKNYKLLTKELEKISKEHEKCKNLIQIQQRNITGYQDQIFGYTKEIGELKSHFREIKKALSEAESDASKFKNKYLETKRKYDALFCEKEGCSNLKYYKFNTCAIHTEADPGSLDKDALSGDRPSTGSVETEEHDSELP